MILIIIEETTYISPSSSRHRDSPTTCLGAGSDGLHSELPPAFYCSRGIKHTRQDFLLVWKPWAVSLAEQGWQTALAVIPEYPGPAGCGERGRWQGIIVHQKLHSLFSLKMILMKKKPVIFDGSEDSENNFGICIYQEPGCFSARGRARQLSWSGRDRSCSWAECAAFHPPLLPRALTLSWPFEPVKHQKCLIYSISWAFFFFFWWDWWAVSVYLRVRMRTGASFRKLGSPCRKDEGAGTALWQPWAVKLVQPLSCNYTEIVYQESNHDWFLSWQCPNNKDNKKQSTANLLYRQAHTKRGIEIENVFSLWLAQQWSKEDPAWIKLKLLRCWGFREDAVTVHVYISIIQTSGNVGYCEFNCFEMNRRSSIVLKQ